MQQILTSIIDKEFLSQPVSAAFYSEAAIQMKLGIELWKKLDVEPKLELYHPESNGYLDIYLEYNGVKYGIELKYKTKSVNGFNYKMQGAQDHGRYDFIKDISRIEAFVKAGFIDAGFSCLITNDPAYWSSPRNGSHSKPFELTNEIILSDSYIPTWKNRTKEISLVDRYPPVQWQSSGQLIPGNAEFKALLIYQQGNRIKSPQAQLDRLG